MVTAETGLAGIEVFLASLGMEIEVLRESPYFGFCLMGIEELSILLTRASPGWDKHIIGLWNLREGVTPAVASNVTLSDLERNLVGTRGYKHVAISNQVPAISYLGRQDCTICLEFPDPKLKFYGSIMENPRGQCEVMVMAQRSMLPGLLARGVPEWIVG